MLINMWLGGPFGTCKGPYSCYCFFSHRHDRPAPLKAALVNAVFIGLSMGTLAFLVDVGLETLNNWKFDATREAIKARPCDSSPPLCNKAHECKSRMAGGAEHAVRKSYS